MKSDYQGQYDDNVGETSRKQSTTELYTLRQRLRFTPDYEDVKVVRKPVNEDVPTLTPLFGQHIIVPPQGAPPMGMQVNPNNPFQRSRVSRWATQSTMVLTVFCVLQQCRVFPLPDEQLGGDPPETV